MNIAALRERVTRAEKYHQTLMNAPTEDVRALLDVFEAARDLLTARLCGLEIVGHGVDGHPLNAEGVAAVRLRAALAKLEG